MTALPRAPVPPFPEDPEIASHDPAGRHRALVVVAATGLLGMALWFTGSAISADLQTRWDLTTGERAWLTSAVQIGFVAGTAVAAVLNLADILPARAYVAGATLLATLGNLAVLLSPSFAGTAWARFATGFFLAGVYPPLMKMLATWFRAERGFAIGALVAALTLGQATPYLVRALGDADLVLVISSGGSLAAAALIFFGYRDGPFAFPRAPFSWALVVEVARHRETRLATAGYLGHMWELYAMWAWLPAFTVASAAAWSARAGESLSAAGATLLASAAIMFGGFGALWGGIVADRRGREWTVNVAMFASGLGAAGVGLAFGQSPWILGPLLFAWGFFIIADSAQFSALVTEVAPPHAVGTALTLQTSAGFLLTMVTVQGVPLLAAEIGWRWSFALLAIGPWAGIFAMRALAKLRRRG